MLVWPDRDQVDEAVRRWAAQELRERPEVRRLGYFGSYARGDWGVGSDLDVIAVVSESAEPFDRRALAWDLETLPVPAEILVYTEEEWRALCASGGRFARTLQRDVVWLTPRPLDHRDWLRNWERVGPLLEQERWERLANMRPEEAQDAVADVLELWDPDVPGDDGEELFLHQRLFARARGSRG